MWTNALTPPRLEAGHEACGGWQRKGLATGWLEREAAKGCLHLPKDPLLPIVMVGPGTGVSLHGIPGVQGSKEEDGSGSW